MLNQVSKLKIVLPVMLAFASSANAEDLANTKLKYEAYYARMKAGEMTVSLNQDTQGNYQYIADVQTNGLAKYITKYWSKSRAEGKYSNEKYAPSLFDTTFQPKRRPKENITITYTKDAVVEVLTPAEDPKRRPKVENEDKLNIPDPITAVLIARDRIRDLVEKGTPLPYNFEQPVFDGRRLFLAKGQIVGYIEKDIDGKKQKVLHLHGQRVPEAGFRAKELKQMKDAEPVFDIYLDNNYIPVLVEGTSTLGEGIITLAKQCSGADCRL